MGRAYRFTFPSYSPHSPSVQRLIFFSAQICIPTSPKPASITCMSLINCQPQHILFLCRYSGTPPYDHLVNTTTSLLRPPRYYDHFFLARQNVHTFSYKNTPFMRPTTTFLIPEVHFPLFLTSLIRPLIHAL